MFFLEVIMKFFNMIYNFFDKIFDFLVDYEDLLKFCFFIFLFLVISLEIARYYDTKSTEEKAIILNTKDYTIFDNCIEFDNKFYCYNIEK